MDDNRFNFFIPATLSKGKDENGNEEMWVEGVASTPEKDLEGESLDPSGYDTSYFLKSGWLKWEHGKDPNQYIGEPTEASVTMNNEFFIKGKLYPESKTAKEVYELASVLEKSDSNRKIGWSIEGKATERDSNDPKKVKKAMITNVVLTTNPIGKNTWASIVKGLYEESYIKPEYKEITTCDGESCLLDIKHDGYRYTLTPEFEIIKKSLEKGDQISAEKEVPQNIIQQMAGKTYDTPTKTTSHKTEADAKAHLEKADDEDEDLPRDFNGNIIEKEKAMSAGHATGTETTNSLDASGAPLKTEDVEGNTKNQSFNIDECDDPDDLKKDCRKKISKALLIVALAHNAGLIDLDIKKVD